MYHTLAQFLPYSYCLSFYYCHFFSCIFFSFFSCYIQYTGPTLVATLLRLFLPNRSCLPIRLPSQQQFLLSAHLSDLLLQLLLLLLQQGFFLELATPTTSSASVLSAALISALSLFYFNPIAVNCTHINCCKGYFS